MEASYSAPIMQQRQNIELQKDSLRSSKPYCPDMPSCKQMLDEHLEGSAKFHGNQISTSSQNLSLAFPRRMVHPSLQQGTSWAGSISSRQSETSRRPSMSIAGSDSSVNSIRSHHSMNSQRSVDSRGFRRGRKQWRGLTAVSPSRTQSCTPFTISDQDLPSATTMYCCTWPECNSRFTTRFEWARHEEALHYFPRRWICCYDYVKDFRSVECFVCQKDDIPLRHLTECHFQSCNGRVEEDRTFWRSDQLVQHVKRAHGGIALPKGLQSVWSSRNPLFKDSDLKCGFCGYLSSTWQERQDHVSRHMQAGAFKESWWPERQPEIEHPAAHSEALRGCSGKRNSWSCRYLDNYQSLGTTSCTLCSYMFSTEEDRKMHATTHALRSCDQEIYWHEKEFTTHLTETHGLATDHAFLPYLWYRQLN